MKRFPSHIRLDEATEAEIKKIAEVTGLSQIEVIRQLVKAGIAAIKEAGYELRLPLKLRVLIDETKGGRKLTTEELDQIAEELLARAAAKSSPEADPGKSSSSRYPSHQPPNPGELHESQGSTGKKKKAA